MVNRAPVSVIIPGYNGEAFIAETIQSVLAQTLPVSEIILVDDASSDDTAKIAAALGVTVIRQRNTGVSGARNAGIRAAKQPWVCLLDQDDLWELEKIELQWAALQLHPEAGVASCYMTWFEDPQIKGSTIVTDTDSSDRFAWKQSEEVNLKQSHDSAVSYFPQVEYEYLLHRMWDKPSSIMVRRDLLLSIGGFDERFRQNEDLDCFLRLVAHSPFVIVERPLVRRRIHERNKSDYSEASMSFLQLVEQINAQPEKYPLGAAHAYREEAWRVMVQAGRLRLNEGRRREARALFAASLKKLYSHRAILLWSASFLSPSVFQRIATMTTKSDR
jgi:glycosyltransferase involved in cell wall biosynthesis